MSQDTGARMRAQTRETHVLVKSFGFCELMRYATVTNHSNNQHCWKASSLDDVGCVKPKRHLKGRLMAEGAFVFKTGEDYREWSPMVRSLSYSANGPVSNLVSPDSNDSIRLNRATFDN